jgi:hypothetical protein
VGADAVAPEPRLSIVVAARNDDHGGGFTRRIETFLHALSAQVERHRLRSELVFVDWASDTLFADVLRWPAPPPWLAMRVIEVPASVHAAMPYGSELTFREMPAKNVGIRRARAPFVLAANVDLVFSDELVHALTGDLSPAAFYRADRYDVDATPDPNEPLDAMLARCARNVIVRHRVFGEEHVDDDAGAERTRVPRLASRRAIRLGRAVRSGPRTIHGHVRRPRELIRVVRERWRRELGIHTDSSGDFTLLAAEAWHRLRGYPELPGHHLHVDSLFLYECHFAGLRQVVLPGPLYHFEHGRNRPPTRRRLPEEESLAPWISTDELYELTVLAATRRTGVLRHTESWGFADLDFRERLVGGAR